MAAEVLYASDLNAEIDNLLNNSLSLISPLTGNLACGDNDLTGIDELAFTSAGANATAAGRLRRNSTNITWHDGTASRNVGFVPTRSSQSVATSETTTSTSYTDLATSGPAVTITPGVATDQLIVIKAEMSTNTGGDAAAMSVAIAGAAASDTDRAISSSLVQNPHSQSSHIFATAVASGSTHTAKYRAVTGGTAAFNDRRITALTVS